MLARIERIGVYKNRNELFKTSVTLLSEYALCN